MCRRTSYGTVRLAAGILVLDAVLFSLFYLPQSVLQGENLGYKRLGLSVLLVFVSKSLLVVAVYFGAGIGGLAVATAVATVLWGVTYLLIVRSRVAWFGIARPSIAEVRHFVGLSWWFLLWNLVMTIMLASDVVVLGVVGSPALVTTYTLAKYLPQAIIVAVATLIVAIMPGLGGMIGAGELTRAVRIRRETMSLIWLFTIVAGTTVLLWEASFLQLWVGERLLPGVRRRLGDHADGAPVRIDPHGRQHHRSDAEPPEEGAPRNDLRRGVRSVSHGSSSARWTWASPGSSSDSSWVERSRASATP